MKSVPDLNALPKIFSGLRYGGRGSPENCNALYRVAIIVPYRDRYEQLLTLLINLHPFLLKQQIDYQIFIVEQQDIG